MDKLKELLKDKRFIAGVILIILAFAIFALNDDSVIGERGKGNVIYQKGDAVYIANISSGENLKFGSFAKSQQDIKKKEVFEKLLNAIYIADDGSMVFTDEIDSSENGFPVYYIGSDAKRSLVSNEVRMYSLSEGIEKIAYIRGENNELYLWENGESEKIADNIAAVNLSYDGDRVIYYTYTKELYVKENEDAPKLIETDVTLEFLSDSSNEIYFTKDSKLYKYAENGDKEYIDEKVVKLLSVGKSGDICYITSRYETFSYYDFILKKDWVLEDISNDFLNELKETELTLKFYSLCYLKDGEREIITDMLYMDEESENRIIGDHIREKDDEILVDYKIRKDFTDSIYVGSDNTIDDLNERLEVSYIGKSTFLGEPFIDESIPYKSNSQTVKFPDSSQYYLKRNDNTYRNLYYKESEDAEEQLIDTLVGYLSVNDSGEVWYLKGYEGEKLELYTVEKTNKIRIASKIERISYVSPIRTREFYKYIEGNERAYFTITDDEKYLKTGFAE